MEKKRKDSAGISSNTRTSNKDQTATSSRSVDTEVKKKLLLLRPRRIGCCGCPPVRHIKHAPSFQHVPYIQKGYRVGFTLKQCFVSLFTLHNESMYVLL